MFAVILCIFISGVIQSNSYVLLQIRKSNNQSDVDALIHKVVPKNTEDISARKHSNDRKNTDKKYNTRDNFVVAVKTDHRQSNEDGGQLENSIVDFFKTLLDNSPNYRSKTGLKPEIVQFRRGKSSTMYEINTDTILSTVQELLASKKFRKYADTLASKAAIIYRAIKEEMRKE